MNDTRRKFFGLLAASGMIADSAVANIPEPSEVQIETADNETFFVLSYDQRVSETNMEQIKSSWKTAFEKQGHKAPMLLLVDGGAKLQVATLPRSARD